MAFIRQLVEWTDKASIIQKVEDAFGDPRSLPELIALLESLVLEIQDCTVFLDGLNEANPPLQAGILHILKTLDARIMITTRDLEPAKAQLERQAHWGPLFTEVVESSIGIDAYIAHAISRNSALSGLLDDDATKQDIVGKMREKAVGM